jgi:hypothetical protein
MRRRKLQLGAGLSAFLVSRFLAVPNEDFLLEFAAPLLLVFLIKKLIDFDSVDHLLATGALTALLSLPVVPLFLSFLPPPQNCMPGIPFHIQEPIEITRISSESVSLHTYKVQPGDVIRTDSLCHSPGLRTIPVGFLDSKVINKPAPRMTAALSSKKLSGEVTVRVLIDLPLGEVICANAVSGPADLRPAATEAARKAVFSPTLVDGDAMPPADGLLTYRLESKRGH